MDQKIISVNDFSFRYPQDNKPAVSHINFEVEKGDFVCVIGKNGSGKSTFCNSLVGLIPHYFVGEMTGKIVIDGMDTSTTSINDLSAKAGLVFQNPFNQLSYTATTVAEELAYGLGNRGVERDEMIKRVKDTAKLMRIDSILDQNPLSLSGGQTQRVALGSILIMHPEVLILDECTTQLDPLGAASIFTIVNNLRKQGITIIMVDHNIDRVATYADKILLLDDGQQIAFGNAKEILTGDLLPQHGVEQSAFTKISKALLAEYYVNGDIAINEEDVIKQAKAGVSYED